MPNEPWNHLEIEGGAWGNVALLTPGNGDPKAVADPDQHDTSPMLAKTLFERPKGQERTSTQFAEPVTGEKVRFTNVEQEWPIGEFAAYYVHPGAEPEGIAKLRYTLSSRTVLPDNPSLDSLRAFIAGRYPVDERATMVAGPGGGVPWWRTRCGRGCRGDAGRGNGTPAEPSLPIVHILIPSDFRRFRMPSAGHGVPAAGRTCTQGSTASPSICRR